jgi:alkanesulfonate monooxygenase SsuD/methylene tetrahydromethanopterin reductase-like flavin-dependent oxidoreductase (luciferase family)
MSEAMNDALAGVEAIALATNHIRVGTWIANIYLRHPALAGASADSGGAHATWCSKSGTEP